MLNLLLGPVVDIVGSSVKGFVETKKAKAEQKVTEITLYKYYKYIILIKRDIIAIR